MLYLEKTLFLQFEITLFVDKQTSEIDIRSSSFKFLFDAKAYKGIYFVVPFQAKSISLEITPLNRIKIEIQRRQTALYI